MLLYGLETCAVTRKEEKLKTTEMCILRWIMRVTLRDRKRNDYIRKELKVCVITEKARECRLKWFGHLHRTEDGTPAKDMSRVIFGKRGRGRPRTRWKNNIKKDLRERNLTENDARDRQLWRSKIWATDPG